MKSNTRQQKIYFALALVGFVLLLIFQNCSQPGSINLRSVSSEGESEFSDESGDNPSPTVVVPVVLPDVKMFATETFVQTELNTAVDFTLKQVSDEILSGVSLEQQVFSLTNGTLVLLDAKLFKFRYSPKVGFRGSEAAALKATDDQGRTVTFNLKIVVANPIQSLKPALAIRGMGCIQCHAKVDSNIITDFGYGSAYYFNKNLGRWI
jgi:hypothetical protein